MASADEPILEIDAAAEPVVVPEFNVVLESPPTPAPAAAVESKKPSILFLAGSLVGGNVASMALRMIGGLLQARFVKNNLYDLFCTIGLVQGYLPFLQLGILNGLNRELPYFIGKGDRRRVNELAAAAQAWSLAVGGLVAAALSGIGVWQLAHAHWLSAAGWFTNGIFAFLVFYNTYYLQMTYRTSHDFARLAVASVVENAVALAAIGLVVLLNFYGMCLRALLAACVSCAFLYYWRPLRIGPRWNWRHLGHLLVIGFPIFTVGQIYAYWMVLNPTLVLYFLGESWMGTNNIAIMAATALEFLPAAVCQVIYPRMAEQYARTGRLGDLVRMAVKPTIVSIGAVGLLVVVGWPLAEPVTRLILPNYVRAVPAMRWYLLVPLVQCLAPINNIYNVVRRQDLYLAAIVLGMGAYFGSLLWLMRDGAELTAFPQAMLIGRLVFVALCYALMPLARRRPATP